MVRPALFDRILALVHRTLDAYPGAWMVWCDPAGSWAPLLEAAAATSAPAGFELVRVERQVSGHLGGLVERQDIAARLAEGQSFVLLVGARPDDLGWLWAQALQAEELYARPLREQLLAWGWRPTSLTMTEDEILQVALDHLHEDPAIWSGTSVQPDLGLLLSVLAGGEDPIPSPVLTLTVEQVGLPAVDAQQLAAWRDRCLACLLVTEAHSCSDQVVPHNHALLIPEGQRRLALELLERWRDSLRLSRGLPERILAADRVAGFVSSAPTVLPETGPYLSRALENAALEAVCAELAQQSGRALLETLADAEPILDRHARGFWGSPDRPQSLPWLDLARLSGAARQVLSAEPARDWSSIQSALDWYVGDGWRLDHAGEVILRPPRTAAPALTPVLDAIRDAFRARWEKTLIEWSALWTGAGCPELPLPRAGAWLASELADERPLAIIVVDALRYDAAVALADRINAKEGADRASVSAAAAPLPSITPLGMGLAMPVREQDLVATYDGRWHLIHQPTDLDLAVAENRRSWWKQAGHLIAENILTVASVLTSGAPSPAPKRARLLLTDDLIDKLGHDDQLELVGTELAVDRYAQAVSLLSEAGWRRIVIVTDHGFIHWTGKDDQSLAPPHPGAAYRSRRALVWPAGTELPLPSVPTPGGKWRVVAARGAASWSAYGGLGYFHGGASLQERVIPCVRVAWPTEAQPVDVAVRETPNILSERPAMVLEVRRASLFHEDALARRVEVVIRDKTSRTILFRSPPTDVRPDQPQARIALEAVTGATADRGTAVVIEVRTPSSEEVIATAESTLMIELSEW